jgi:hypothetical protein
LPQQIDSFLSYFGLRQDLSFERPHPRVVERKVCLVERASLRASGRSRTGSIAFTGVCRFCSRASQINSHAVHQIPSACFIGRFLADLNVGAVCAQIQD